MLRWSFSLLFAAALPLIAQSQSVTLQPYRQSDRTLHQPDDPAVPPGLRNGSTTAKASDGSTWTASDRGVWREATDGHPADRKRYFASRRWLPDDRATALFPDSSGGMWIRTGSGVSHIFFRKMTLEEKAVPFEQRVEARHNRHGMVASSHLRVAGDLSSNQVGTTDNDGLWTAMYGAGECFRYAVTKSPEALRLAKRSVEVLLKLQEVTGRPGYPARSYLLPDEPRPNGGVWYLQPDGRILWKGDTSSDEIVGYYFLYSIAYDLLPDAALKKRIVTAVTEMTDLILKDGLTLTDIHGLPSWWGRWDPEYFRSERGKGDSPLNSVEILSFLKAAHHVTGEARFGAAYTHWATTQGYARITAQYKELRETINYSDEELAMLSFYPLLQYEKDKKLLSFYHDGLSQWWANMAREKNPLWTFIYAASNPPVRPNLDDAVWTLQRIPLDLVQWSVQNSHRSDVQWEARTDRFNLKQAITLLPADERPVMKWNGNPFRIDGGGAGRAEDDGAFFLLPYWMGRHHRLIKGR